MKMYMFSPKYRETWFFALGLKSVMMGLVALVEAMDFHFNQAKIEKEWTVIVEGKAKL